MKSLLLDTHILLWYINEPNLLSQNLMQAIQHYDEIFVSAVSCFEINWLITHHRINLPDNLNYASWIANIQRLTDIQFLNITPKIASFSVELPEHHKDPWDRLIIATALIHNLQLASVDEKFVLYNELKDKLINK